MEFTHLLGWNILKTYYVVSMVWHCGLTQTIDNPTWFRKAVEQRLRNIWITNWYSNLTSKSICSTYKLYKEAYGIMEYLIKLNKCNRRYITKLLTGNNQLPIIIRGRHRHLNREDRYCTAGVMTDKMERNTMRCYSVKTKILFS